MEIIVEATVEINHTPNKDHSHLNSIEEEEVVVALEAEVEVSEVEAVEEAAVMANTEGEVVMVMVVDTEEEVKEDTVVEEEALEGEAEVEEEAGDVEEVEAEVGQESQIASMNQCRQSEQSPKPLITRTEEEKIALIETDRNHPEETNHQEVTLKDPNDHIHLMTKVMEGMAIEVEAEEEAEVSVAVDLEGEDSEDEVAEEVSGAEEEVTSEVVEEEAVVVVEKRTSTLLAHEWTPILSGLK